MSNKYIVLEYSNNDIVEQRSAAFAAADKVLSSKPGTKFVVVNPKDNTVELLETIPAVYNFSSGKTEDIFNKISDK